MLVWMGSETDVIYTGSKSDYPIWQHCIATCPHLLAPSRHGCPSGSSPLCRSTPPTPAPSQVASADAVSAARTIPPRDYRRAKRTTEQENEGRRGRSHDSGRPHDSYQGTPGLTVSGGGLQGACNRPTPSLQTPVLQYITELETGRLIGRDSPRGRPCHEHAVDS